VINEHNVLKSPFRDFDLRRKNSFFDVRMKRIDRSRGRHFWSLRDQPTTRNKDLRRAGERFIFLRYEE